MQINTKLIKLWILKMSTSYPENYNDLHSFENTKIQFTKIKFLFKQHKFTFS